MVWHGKVQFIKDHFHQRPLSSKNHFHQKTTFIRKPLSSENHFHQKTTSCQRDPGLGGGGEVLGAAPAPHHHHPSKNNIDRVCVKASRADVRRRLHTNTACAHLSGFNGPSCEASSAEGRQCSC